MEASNRVMGIESEYGLTYAFSEEQIEDRARRSLPPQVWGADPGSAISIAFNDYLPAELPRAGQSLSFLGNGMRLYQDVGSHPEAAGAESTEVEDIIDGDAAADKLVWRALRDAYVDGAIRNFMLFRRTIDGQGTSWGRHENYRMDRSLILDPNSEHAVSQQKMKALVGFLAVRPMMGGAGCLHNGVYWMGQKIITAMQDVDSGTTRFKPLVNTRDEPLGEGYRQHIVCVDYTSPHVTARNLETTSLVSRMIEHGMAPNFYGPYPNWASFGKQISTDFSLTHAATINGKSMTGLNVHEMFLEAADAMPDELLSPAERRGRVKWHAIYERLKTVPQAAHEGSLQERAERVLHALDEHLAGHVDWADRLKHIREVSNVRPEQHAHSEEGISFETYAAAAAQADIMFDLVGRGTGLSRTYVNRLATSQAAPYVDQWRIAHRMLHAPATGRAALRGKFLHEFKDDPNTTADWSVVGYYFVENGQLRAKFHRMNDPVTSEDGALDGFMKLAQRAQPKSRALYEKLERQREARSIAM